MIMTGKSRPYVELLLGTLLLFGAALTVYGGLRLLGDANDLTAANAFCIGVGLLLPLLAILGLRLFPALPRKK
jgi:hypothetical protein